MPETVDLFHGKHSDFSLQETDRSNYNINGLIHLTVPLSLSSELVFTVPGNWDAQMKCSHN